MVSCSRLAFTLAYFAPALGVILLGNSTENGHQYCQTSSQLLGACVDFEDCPNANIWFRYGRHPEECYRKNHSLPERQVVCCATLPEVTQPPYSVTRACGRIVQPYETPDLLVFRIPGSKPDLGNWTKWRWLVSIHRKENDGNSSFQCGGSVIGAKAVLTSAHCFAVVEGKVDDSRYVVRTGKPVKTYEIASVTTHPRYNPGEHYNDVALVILYNEIEMVHPICLPWPNLTEEVLAGRNVTLVGWGVHYDGNENKLRESEMSVLSREKCNNSYFPLSTHHIPAGITEEFVCAGYLEKGKRACQADTGGPLMLHMDGRWILIGVVSFGYFCTEDYPGVYVRVTTFLDWITMYGTRYLDIGLTVTNHLGYSAPG